MANHLKSIIIVIGSIILCTPLFVLGAELYFVDAHSQMDKNVPESTILKLMDRNGVRRTILASRSGLRPSEIISFADKHPDKIIPSMSTKQSGYVSLSKEKQKKSIKAMKKMSNSGRFRAIAETLMWHSGCPKNLCPSVEVYAQDARVRKALEIAVENDWPFIVHIEFGSLSGIKRQRFFDDLESILRKYPQHPIALIHMGQLHAADVRNLIGNHKNIYFLTAHTNTYAVRSAAGFKPWIDMFDGKEFKPLWRQLLIEYPERFIFAMDNVFSQTHWQSGLYGNQIKLWREALEKLPEEVAHALAHRNAERLWKISALDN